MWKLTYHWRLNHPHIWTDITYIPEKPLRWMYRSGADSGVGGGAPRAPPPPPKIGKNMIFWRKIVIFHTKYPKNFRASLYIWKKSDFFWRKIVIFHTKYPKFFAPPSARRNFFKCDPLNLKSWIRPCRCLKILTLE